jgi:hypothetical protein
MVQPLPAARIYLEEGLEEDLPGMWREQIKDAAAMVWHRPVGSSPNGLCLIDTFLLRWCSHVKNIRTEHGN